MLDGRVNSKVKTQDNVKDSGFSGSWQNIQSYHGAGMAGPIQPIWPMGVGWEDSTLLGQNFGCVVMDAKKSQQHISQLIKATDNHGFRWSGKGSWRISLDTAGARSGCPRSHEILVTQVTPNGNFHTTRFGRTKFIAHLPGPVLFTYIHIRTIKIMK